MKTIRSGLSALLVVLGLIITPIVSSASSTKSPAINAKAEGTFPVTVRASNGNITIKTRPTRIVSLSPTATEMLFAIGAGHQVKAVDSYSDYPPSAPKTNLSAYTPNVEAIAKYKPDLVIVSEDSVGFAKQMANLKIPVIYDPTAANLNQAYHEYLGLGAATGNRVRARIEVARVQSKISEILKTTPRAPAGTTYYYELDPTYYYSVTSSTFVGQLLGLLGLKSIADSATGVATSGGYPQLNAEFILKANPTYIFLADTICCQATAQSVAARPGWSALSAVSNGRIGALNDDIASRWGPRITVLLQDVANVLKANKG